MFRREAWTLKRLASPAARSEACSGHTHFPIFKYPCLAFPILASVFFWSVSHLSGEGGGASPSVSVACNQSTAAHGPVRHRSGENRWEFFPGFLPHLFGFKSTVAGWEISRRNAMWNKVRTVHGFPVKTLVGLLDGILELPAGHHHQQEQGGGGN